MTELDPRDTVSAVVRALVMYALAEAQSGHARSIRVTAEGASFSIADDGRGHPLAKEIDGTPYLQLVYSHLDYPFGAARAASVQLQGLGLSLINTLCSELTSQVRKPDATLRLRFHQGRLEDHLLTHERSGEIGNLITGTVRADIAGHGADVGRLQRWLRAVQASCPAVQLFFNGQPLSTVDTRD